jgi:alpha-methylacyl-CoA racemase
MGEPEPTSGLLQGVRVLDLSIWRPAPYATQLLAELGAEVIKVEPPGGDPMRTYPGLFAGLHADKRGLVLDLKDPVDRARALELAAGADVVVEGFRPGVVDRLGVGYEQVRAVNPGVVYCSVSGLGQDGPLAFAPGHDLNYGAWSAMLAPDGGEPAVPAIPVADLAGGMAAAFAVCAALVRATRTGEGERIDVAMAGVLATWTGVQAPATEESTGERDEPNSRGVPGYGTFATAAGGYVVLGVISEDHFWGPLCRALGLDDEAGLGFAARMARLDELQAHLSAAIAGRGRDELVETLLAAGVPVAPVLDRAEMVGLDHFRAIGAVTAHPWSDPASGFPVRLTHHPARRLLPPPELDQHPDATWAPRQGS